MKIRRFQIIYKYRKLLSFAMGICIVVYWFFYFKDPNIVLPKDLQNRKCILYYNPPESISQQVASAWDFSACIFSECRLTTVKSEISSCEYVIFNHYTMPFFRPKKESFQKWIFTSSECPYETYFPFYMKLQWSTSFDFVMSYRRDSDFFFGYGAIIPRKEPIKKDYDAVFKQKEKDVAWIVSHCKTKSKREQYVQEMKKVIDIDIFGKCGDKYCDIYKGNENDTCHDVVGKKCKFYLSFENSVCKDYTTEKLYFVYAFGHNIIPVVRGAFNSKDYLPKEGATYTDDFKSPTHLARYLKEIGSDKKRYIKLLQHKDHYTAKTSPETFNDSMCSMCKKLSFGGPKQTHRNLDIVKWWWHDMCQEPRDLP